MLMRGYPTWTMCGLLALYVKRTHRADWVDCGLCVRKMRQEAQREASLRDNDHYDNVIA